MFSFESNSLHEGRSCHLFTSIVQRRASRTKNEICPWHLMCQISFQQHLLMWSCSCSDHICCVVWWQRRCYKHKWRRASRFKAGCMDRDYDVVREKIQREAEKKKKGGDFFMVKKNMQKYGEKYSNVRVQNTGPYILPGKQCFFGGETCCLIIWKQILRLWRSNHMGMNIYFRLDLKVEHPAIRIVKNWNRLLWGWNYWRFLKAD